MAGLTKAVLDNSLCFSPGGAGGLSKSAIFAELKKRMFTNPPTSPQTKMVSFVSSGLDLKIN